MPWRLIRIRKSGRQPLNSHKCMICEKELIEREAWTNRNTHRSKYICKICFPKLWV